MHKHGKWPIFVRWIQTPGFRWFIAYEGSQPFYSTKTIQKPAIFKKFWILLDENCIKKCLELMVSLIFFLYIVPTKNFLLGRKWDKSHLECLKWTAQKTKWKFKILKSLLHWFCSKRLKNEILLACYFKNANFPNFAFFCRYK